MPKIFALATAAAVVCLTLGCAGRPHYVFGVTKGDAHARADAQCRPLGERARVHLYLNNTLAFECYDPRTGVSDRPLGLTDGAL